MNIYIVIPAHNEAQYIDQMLQSLLTQTLLPQKVIVVNDNSTDNTTQIVNQLVQNHPWISLINNPSNTQHLPGSKVIKAFQKGLQNLDDHYDILIKLDADLILPPHYLQTVVQHFQSDPTIGMVGGFAYIQNNGNWILENLTDKTHIRGAFKAYRKKCFQQIGGLKPQMGWDTVDELLARYYGWKIITDPQLQVKHLKPTGAQYNKNARYKQGEAFYTLGYGIVLTVIASLKLALKKQKPFLTLDYLVGYYKAYQQKTPKMVTPHQQKFIQNYRWKLIKQKLIS